MNEISKGLIINEKWAKLILQGKKTIELRGSNTKIRGKIGIIISGSKKVYGTVDVIGCIEINKDEYYRLVDKHCYPFDFDTIKYKKLYGWILKNANFYEQPKPYNHKLGCVVWVNLE